MSTLVPSYLAKVHRADKHLLELKAEIARYADRKPYKVVEANEGKKARMVRRLEFTADPANTDIPIIAADVIYNLRSSLDHLMAALVAPKKRSSAMFPIFFKGVWEPEIEEENEQRKKDRGRWVSDTKTVEPRAVDVLRGLQPPDNLQAVEAANLLQFINRLSNRDRHQRLPVATTGLDQMLVRFKTAGGVQRTGLGRKADEDRFFSSNAIIQFPDDAQDLEIEGIPIIVIKVGEDETGRDRYLRIPEELERTSGFIKNMVIAKLSPYVRD